MSDSDEIRRRRIERLAMLERAQSESRNRPEERITGRTTEPEPEAKKTSTAVPSASPSTASAPVDKQPLHNVPSDANADRKPPLKRAPRSASSIPSVSFVFGTTGLAEDWNEAAENADGMLWDEMTNSKNGKSRNPISYLVKVFNRSEKLERDLPAVAAKIKETAVTMAYISATADPEDEVYGSFSSALLQVAQTSELNKQFVSKVLGLASDDSESLPTFIRGTVEGVLRTFYYGAPTTVAVFQILDAITDTTEAAELLLQLPGGTTLAQPPAVIARHTFLGTVLGYGLADLDFWKVYPTETLVRSSVNELVQHAKQSDTVTTLLNDLQFKLVSKLIRKNASTRRLVLDWFSLVLNGNHGQMAMNRIRGKTNSLQLMLNAFKMLLRLAEPFIKLDSGSLILQLSKVNPSYFANKASFDVSDETKVLAAQDAPFNSRSSDEQLNFVTECFFLCAAFLHYGYHATVQAVGGSLKREVEYFENQLSALNDAQSAPTLPGMRELTIGRYTELLKLAKSELAGLTSTLRSPDVMGQVLRFSEFTLAYDVYAAENFPKAGLEVRIPWDSEPPESYASFPEFLIEAPAAAASYILRSPEFLNTPSMAVDNELLIDSCIFFMSSPKILRNPYLRSRFVEILYYGGSDVPLTSGQLIPGSFSTLFTTSDTCRQFLLPALMAVFIDVEHTGRTSQFYEKFTTREFVANVLKVLWRNPHYRSQLITESESQPEFFVKFVALLLNDATFLLDEALGKLLEVHKLQHDDPSLNPSASGASRDESSNTESAANSIRSNNGSVGGENANNGANDTNDADENDGGNSDSEEDSESSNDPAARLRSAERQAQNLLQLSNSTMMLLSTFTGSVPQIFATPEIIDRFSIMLNYNLAALVGPRCNQLKVKNPAELGFRPRELLSDLVKVYLNLRNEAPFAKSLSKDERSYRDENFQKALRLMTKFSLLSPLDLDNFAALAVRTKEAWQETQAEEEEFGDDIPDEYLDPLMFEMMSNPVTLPTSKVNIDLSTIKTHLLSDPTDPFNRVPLKIEDVIPNNELKAEIEEFRRKKKEQGRKKHES